MKAAVEQEEWRFVVLFRWHIMVRLTEWVNTSAIPRWPLFWWWPTAPFYTT